MRESYSKPIDYTKLVELASKYSRVDLAKGNFKGKGTGTLRNLETRLRVLSILAPKSEFTELDKVYDIIAEKKKSYYWNKVMKQPDRKLGQSVSMAEITIQNELMPYSIKENKDYATLSGGIKETNTTKNKKKGLEEAINKISNFATVCIVGAAVISGCIGYHARDSEIEKLKSQKSHMIIMTDLSSKELDQRYEGYSKQEKQGQIPILDLRHTEDKKENIMAKAESKKEEIKVAENKGVFPQGYCYKKEIPEFTPEKLAKREKYRKIYSDYRKKAGDELTSVPKWIGHSLLGIVKMPFDAVKTVYNTVTIPFQKHGFKETWKSLKNTARDAWDVGEGINKSTSGLTLGTIDGLAGTTPIGVLDKEINALDWTVWNTYDALPFGDYDGKIKYELLRIDRWAEKDGFWCTTFNKKHPENVIKTPISLVSDYFLFKLLFDSMHFGGGAESSEASVISEPGRSGGAAAGIIGRSGGAGVP